MWKSEAIEGGPGSEAFRYVNLYFLQLAVFGVSSSTILPWYYYGFLSYVVTVTPPSTKTSVNNHLTVSPI